MTQIQSKYEQACNKLLNRELPYYGHDIRSVHGQFNNSLYFSLPTRKSLSSLSSFHDLDLFSLNNRIFDDLSSNNFVLKW